MLNQQIIIVTPKIVIESGLGITLGTIIYYLPLLAL